MSSGGRFFLGVAMLTAILAVFMVSDKTICAESRRGEEMIYYVDNGERGNLDRSAYRKKNEDMAKSLKPIYGVDVVVRHYSEVSMDEVRSLKPLAAVLSGCGTPYEQFIKCDFSKESELIRSGLIPVLGICGGHQVIGMAYNSEIAPIRKLRPDEEDKHVGTASEGFFYEIGKLPVKIIRNDPLFEGLEDTLIVDEGHYCEIKDLPPDFELLASTEECRIQAMKHKRNLTYGVQFHPNVYSDEYPDGEKILGNFLKLAEKWHRKAGK